MTTFNNDNRVCMSWHLWKGKKKKDKKEGQLHINGKEAAVDALCHCMALKIRIG